MKCTFKYLRIAIPRDQRTPFPSDDIKDFGKDERPPRVEIYSIALGRLRGPAKCIRAIPWVPSVVGACWKEHQLYGLYDPLLSLFLASSSSLSFSLSLSLCLLYSLFILSVHTNIVMRSTAKPWCEIDSLRPRWYRLYHTTSWFRGKEWDKWKMKSNREKISRSGQHREVIIYFRGNIVTYTTGAPHLGHRVVDDETTGTF